MYFDRLGEQQVLKRRRPSPIRKTKRPGSSTGTAFSQEVRPRPVRRIEASGRGGFRGSLFGSLFHGILHAGPDRSRGINLEKPKRRARPAVRSQARAEGETLSRPDFGVASDEGQTRIFGGIRLPSSWAKKLALALALLAVGIIGLNWEGVSGTPAGSGDISPASLEDPVAPLSLWAPGLPDLLPPLPDLLPPLPGEVEASVENPVADTDTVSVPFTLTETFRWTPYVVSRGDTISRIASRHSVSQGSIIALNDIKETWNLQVGRTLKIPNMDGIPHTVAANETLTGIARARNVPLNVLLDANDLFDDALEPGQVLFVPGARMDPAELRKALWRAPVKPMIRPAFGRITSPFGWREDPLSLGSGRMQFHQGVDISGNVGDPVKASMDGTVMHRGANPQFGNFMVLQHGEYQTLYAHLSSFSVGQGQSVRQGQEIGKIGSTGRSTGPHLHFGVFHKGEPVNPIDRWR